MPDRDRNLDASVLPGAQGAGVPIIVPEHDENDHIDETVLFDEAPHDAPEDDSKLLDTDSPDFDHSLRRRKKN